MDIFSVFALLGGLALFLFGMHVLSEGLEKMAGGKIEKVLGKATSSRVTALLLGAGVTAAVQSSSAVTVMLVGLVNSGILSLTQAIGVIMGSNIGTTITSWILSLSGISSDLFILKMLKPTNFSPIIAFIGIVMIMASKKQKRKDTGTIFLGFAILMYGMSMMTTAVAPLKDMPEFTNILVAFQNPLLGVLVGTIVTAAIQASAASVGILQALAVSGSITYGAAIPIIMGQNIGTCISALMSAIGTKKNARRVACVHVLFNVIGTVICLAAWLIADAIFKFAITDAPVTPFAIAVMHSIFNVVTTFMLFPFVNLLEKLAKMIVKGKKDEEVDFTVLDDRIMAVPHFAVSQAYTMTETMSKMAREAFLKAKDLLVKFDDNEAEQISSMEDQLDHYESNLGKYLVKLSNLNLTHNEARHVSLMMRTLSDFERIGDHAQGLKICANNMKNKELSFSPEAFEEIENLNAMMVEMLDLTIHSFASTDSADAIKIGQMQQKIGMTLARMKDHHIKRLQKGKCTVEMGLVLMEVLSSYSSISDHCANVGIAILETSMGVNRPTIGR